MEGIGVEVSHKIRSAIKAKLMELGAYVDEELPDYIMVMVANKRSKQQMENDLDLFLGDSAAVFTTWLHQVLSKLQEVTVSSLDKKSTASEEVDKKKKSVQSDENRKEKEKEKKRKGKKEKEDETSEVKSKVKENDTKQEDSQPYPTVDKDSNAVQKIDVQSHVETLSPAQGSAHGKTAPVPKPVCQTDEDDDDFINLKADAETDLWEGETEDMSVNDVKNSDSDKVVPKLSENENNDSSQEQSKPAQRTEIPVKQSEPFRSAKPPAEMKTIVPPPSVRAAPSSRIIKISEVLREEKETLNPSLKRNLDDKRQPRRLESSEASTVPTTQVPLAHRLGRRHVDKAVRRRSSDVGLPSRLAARKAVHEASRGSGRAGSGRDREETGIASVIRVLPRPRRPAALQPSCSLILKAVAEAEKSVATARRPSEKRSPLRSRQPAPTVAPALVVPKVPEVYSKSPLFTRAYWEKANLVRTVVNTDICDEPMDLKDEESIVVPDYEDSVDDKTESVGLRPQSPKNILVQVSSSDRYTSLQGIGDRSARASVVSVTSARSPSPLPSPLPPSPSSVQIQANSPPPPPPPPRPPPPQTSRMANVSRWLEGVQQVADTGLDVDTDTDTDGARSSKQDADMDDGESELELGAGLDVLDDDDDDDNEAETDDNERHQRDSSPKYAPQFVVTLDGLDPLLLRSFGIDAQNHKRHLIVETEQQDDEQQLRAELLSQQAAAAAAAAAKTNARSFPSNQDESAAPEPMLDMPALGQDFQGTRARELQRAHLKRPASPIVFEEPCIKKGSAAPSVGDLVSAPSKAKPSEKCKFWPSCRQGDLCEYHHPSVPCRTFPNCKFGDGCLYIHPNCRYDSACSRRDCPYVHSSHRLLTTPAVPSKSAVQPCKFFPRCTNTSCPFLHPKMCRFGAYCSKQNCQFAHDEKLSTSKMKWISPQQ